MKGIIKKEFAGKVRGFAFNMNTWEIVCEKLDMPISDVLQALSGKKQLKTMIIIIYAALSSYADFYEEEFELTEKAVGFHFNVGDPIFVEVMACMNESMNTSKALPQGDGKKKSISVT